MPVSTTIRAANADELGVIARRMDRGREGAVVSAGAWRREAVGLGVIGALATVASTVLFFRTQSGAFVLGGALGMTFVAFGLLGSRRAGRLIEVRLTEIGRDQAETADTTARCWAHVGYQELLGDGVNVAPHDSTSLIVGSPGCRGQLRARANRTGGAAFPGLSTASWTTAGARQDIADGS